MKDRIRAYFFLAAAMSIAGSAVVAGKRMVSDLPVFLAAELGILVSLLFLLPLAARQRNKTAKINRRAHMVLFLQALCGVVLYRVFIFQGLQYTSAAAGGLISGAAPVCIALLARVLLGEYMTGNRVLGAVCVSLGIAAVNLRPFLDDSPETANAILGNGLILAAVLCESLFSVLSKTSGVTLPALSRTALVSSYAFVCLLPFALHDALGYDFSAITGESLFCIAYYGIFVSFLSYVFWFKGIATVPAGIAASFTGFVPLSGVLLSWSVLHEPVMATHCAGLLFVLGGILLACLPERQGRGHRVPS